ncbi:MAG: glutamyl-tRNA reductase [Limisphaerales bacterium]|jgi:glutamyl-tRNA reductase
MTFEKVFILTFAMTERSSLVNRYKLVTVTHKEVPLTQLGKYFIAQQNVDSFSQDQLPETMNTRTGKADQNASCISTVSDLENGTGKSSNLTETNKELQHAARMVRLEELKNAFGLEELFYLETCNRVIYLFVTPDSGSKGNEVNNQDQKEWDDNRLLTFFQFINPLLGEDELYRAAEACKLFEGELAIRHILEVSASLDSLVIGERQILGQLREAFTACTNAGFIGDHLRLAFKYTVPSAKKIYTDTQIGDKPISIVSLAARSIRDSKLKTSARILMIGAGQTNRLMAKFLRQYGFTNVDVFNRSIKAAEELANGFTGVTGTFDALHSYDREFDVIAICTGSAQPVLSDSLYAHLSKFHKGADRLIIDLAVPADVDHQIIPNYSINYVGIEQLREAAEQNLSFRRKELKTASSMVDIMVTDYQQLFKQRQMEKAMNCIPSEVRALRQRAMSQVFKAEIESLDPDAKETLDKVLDYMEKKYVSIPMSAARKVMASK